MAMKTTYTGTAISTVPGQQVAIVVPLARAQTIVQTFPVPSLSALPADQLIQAGLTSQLQG